MSVLPSSYDVEYLAFGASPANVSSAWWSMSGVIGHPGQTPAGIDVKSLPFFAPEDGSFAVAAAAVVVVQTCSAASAEVDAERLSGWTPDEVVMTAARPAVAAAPIVTRSLKK